MCLHQIRKEDNTLESLPLFWTIITFSERVDQIFKSDRQSLAPIAQREIQTRPGNGELGKAIQGVFIKGKLSFQARETF